MNVIVNPTNISLELWSALLASDLPQIPYVQYTGGDWREWAAKYLQNIPFAPFDMPQPQIYKDWREWAYDFIRNYN